jgi:hypothetical protein
LLASIRMREGHPSVPVQVSFLKAWAYYGGHCGSLQQQRESLMATVRVKSWRLPHGITHVKGFRRTMLLSA